MVCAGLALAVAAVYWPVRDFQFLIYDDTVYVSLNEKVHKGLSWSQIVWAFTTQDCGFWHPLTWLSYLIDWEFYGRDAGKHHLTSLVMHIISSVVMFLAWKRLSGNFWCSAFVTAIFALHPHRVESVAWVAERKDVLSTVFFVLTFWAYAHFARAKIENGELRAPKSRQWYVLAVIFFTLGLMAKPTMVTMPFVLLLLDFWPLKRVIGEEPHLERKTLIRRLLELAREKIPFFVLAFVGSVLAFVAGKSIGAVTSLAKLPFDARVYNMFVAYLHYFKTFLWPDRLASPYPHPIHWPWAMVVTGIIVVILCSAMAVWLWRRQPWWFVGWFWFLGTLIPVIGLVQLGAHAYADRYTYMSTIGLAAAFTWWASSLTAKWPSRKIVLSILGVAAVIGCGASTRNYLMVWKNTGTLFEHTIKFTRPNAFAHNNLALYYLENGRNEEAIQHARRALEIVPTYPDPHSTLAFGNYMLRRMDEALPEFEKALEFDPKNSRLYNGYGAALGSVGKGEQACDIFRKSIGLNPQQAEAHHNLAFTLARLGKYEEAIPYYQEAIRLDANYAMAYYSLGNAYQRLGKIDEARKNYEACLRVKPDFADAQKQLQQLPSGQTTPAN